MRRVCPASAGSNKRGFQGVHRHRAHVEGVATLPEYNGVGSPSWENSLGSSLCGPESREVLQNGGRRGGPLSCDAARARCSLAEAWGLGGQSHLVTRLNRPYPYVTPESARQKHRGWLEQARTASAMKATSVRDVTSGRQQQVSGLNVS